MTNLQHSLESDIQLQKSRKLRAVARPGQATVVALPVIDTLDTVLGLYEKA